MGKAFDGFGKAVWLNLIGEIAEVVSFDSSEITVRYHGSHITMKRYEVSRVIPEEAAVATSQIDKPKSQALKHTGNERVFIFQRDKGD